MNRDQSISLFREIWNACQTHERHELELLLHSLVLLQTRLADVTRFRLEAPNVATPTFEYAPELIDEHPLNAIIARTPQQFICPEEYLCAIACWKADEVYVPANDFQSHPRYPYYHPFDRTKPAN